MATSSAFDVMKSQRDLLAEALGKLLVAYKIIRPDAALTGPELLMAVETAVLPDNDPRGGLTFNALREANNARVPIFKNAVGETHHSGQDWSINDWMVATMGEVVGEAATELVLFLHVTSRLGHAANRIKKIRRGDVKIETVREPLAKEFGDTVVYLDILAHECGIDLGEATQGVWKCQMC